MNDESVTSTRLKQRFAAAILAQHVEHGDETFVIQRDAWRDVMRFLRDDPDLRYNFLMDLTAVDYQEMRRTPRYEVVAHLYSLPHNQRVRLKAPVPDDDPCIASLMPVWEGANWFEREAYDMFGLTFEGHPDLRRILLYQGFEGYPLRKDYPQDKEQPLDHNAFDPSFYMNKRNETGTETRHMLLHMGPSHPAMHGVIHLTLELDGETIIDGDTEIGYLHRAFEKESESHTYTQVIPYTDRLNYVSPLINNVAYVLAVEKLFDVQVPERCQYIRVLVSELSRITDHLTCVAANAMELGAFTVFFYFIKAREEIWRLVESICGARLTTTYTRVGGVMADLPDGFREALAHTLAILREAMHDVERLIQKNRIFYDRMRGTGIIAPQDAIALSFTGPVLRSAGVNYDVRKANPYLVYDQLEFDVPLGDQGDNYDRYLVRMEEIRQSIRLVEQCMQRMPAGPVQLDDARMTMPPKAEVYGTIEGLMNHFKLIIDGIKPPPGEAYVPVEGANGELGFYIVSDGTGRPYRCRVRPPCFALMQGLQKMLKGGMVADIVATFGTINMIAGENDR
ncbi:MAG: NADH-quinone oxidoreductase subunit D [Candidatus Tectomicrobia bacterium]|uniref:NADH-quinone oxidoreductase subunit D n=1 Tax=Tectimicrobiota bacterium TaxID=2528274 RepID=A0A938B3Z9_UNCTE|nr:NADH-quinone oxidoreductase subunit D [Candidatus Tectomicrobia bacterium]